MPIVPTVNARAGNHGASSKGSDFKGESSADALLALSHTSVEHDLYTAMRREMEATQSREGVFTIRQLMTLTQLRSYSTVRRGLAGLIKKLSIEPVLPAADSGPADRDLYAIYGATEIFARRRASGLPPYPKEVQACSEAAAFGMAIERLVSRHDLSRREASVALCCVCGLSNAEIGERLFISLQTVKFHLRHIFVKFGVRRRTELVSCLLSQSSEPFHLP